MKDVKSKTLTRSLGLTSAVFLGLGSIFGTGIFVSIGIAAGITGPSVLAAILLAAIIATCNALSSAQLAASYPVSGGTYEYGYLLIGPNMGFSAGWLFLMAKSASAATAALGGVSYFLHLIGITTFEPLAASAFCLVLAVTLLVLSGLRRSNFVNIVIVSLTLMTLSAFIIATLWQIKPDNFNNLTPFFKENTESSIPFLYASALMFVAFTGYGRIATMGEEVRSPRKTIPRAINLTLIVSAVIYLLVGAALILTLGTDKMTFQTDQMVTPLQTASRGFGFPALNLLISIGAVTAMVGVLLNLILGLSRVSLAMARRRDLPYRLAGVSRTGNPNFSIICIGLFIAALTLIGDIKFIWSFSALTVLVYYSITNIAAWRQPKQERLYPRFIPALGLLGCISLAVFIPLPVWLIGLTVLAIGFVLKLLFNNASKDNV